MVTACEPEAGAGLWAYATVSFLRRPVTESVTAPLNVPAGVSVTV